MLFCFDGHVDVTMDFKYFVTFDVSTFNFHEQLFVQKIDEVVYADKTIVIGGDVTVDVIQHAQVVKSQWFPVLES